MKSILLQSFLIVFLLKTATAQQLIYNSFYRQNWQLINPAATDPTFSMKRGSDNPRLIFQGNIRQQWAFSGIHGAPRFLYFSGEYSPTLPANGAPANFTKFGLAAVADQTDALKTLGIFLNAAYFIAGDDDYFSMGFSPGYVFTTLDQDKLRLAETTPDPLVAAFEKHSAIEVPFGFFYRRGNLGQEGYDSYYIGLSAPHGVAFNLSNARELGGGFASYKKLHLNAVFGYITDLTRGVGQFESFKLEPTVWLRWAKGAKLGGDIGTRALFETTRDNGFWLGSSVGTNTQFNFETGFYRLLNSTTPLGYRIGFVYGAPPFGKYHRLGNSFEISIAFYGN